MSVEFHDFSLQVKNALADKEEAFLHEAAGEVKSQAAQISRVASGQLKGAWDYSVDMSREEAKIGSPLENAIWNELGTGEYAANGDGRKGGWAYQDENGKWHFTRGKKPNHTLQRSFDSKKAAIIARAKELFGGLGK